MSTRRPSTDFELGDEFARVLAETTQSLVCVLDEAGRALLFNDACERATGFSRDEVIGRDLTDTLIPPEESDAFREVLAYIWSSGDASPQVGHWRTKDGGLRLIAWSNKLVPATASAPAYLVASGIDLTEREAVRRGRARRRLGVEARRGQPAGPGAACASARGDARRLGGEPGARLHGRVDGVRARARGERVVRLALRGRRHRHRRRGLQPRRDRPVPARHSPVRRADHADRAHARNRPALPGRRLGHGRGRVQGADAADRLPLDGGGADHRRRHALGCGHDQQRRPAAGQRRGAARRVLRPRLARGRERAGTRGPADVALADRPGRRRAAPAARAQPARRRPATARRGDAPPARGAGEARAGAGGRGQAAPGRRRRARRRARGAARARARSPPGRAHRPRPARGARSRSRSGCRCRSRSRSRTSGSTSTSRRPRTSSSPRG